VTVLDGHSARRKRTVKHAGAVRCVGVAGNVAIVADGTTGRLKSIRLGAGR
jgi:hypothetical protein